MPPTSRLVDYIDRAIEWAAKYNIRVLLDLATVPGGQGDSNDSPATPEAVAEWHSSTNGRHVALDVLERLADRYVRPRACWASSCWIRRR